MRTVSIKKFLSVTANDELASKKPKQKMNHAIHVAKKNQMAWFMIEAPPNAPAIPPLLPQSFRQVTDTPRNKH